MASAPTGGVQIYDGWRRPGSSAARFGGGFGWLTWRETLPELAPVPEHGGAARRRVQRWRCRESRW
uniref:Uncharacterized protein n=1 Tax=Oryza meridionalis TaxID=40149 RepID=A0A0E0DAR6_9ORYZ